MMVTTVWTLNVPSPAPEPIVKGFALSLGIGVGRTLGHWVCIFQDCGTPVSSTLVAFIGLMLSLPSITPMMLCCIVGPKHWGQLDFALDHKILCAE